MSAKKIAVVFPGLGSQRVGMAKDFIETYSESRAIFDIASDALGVDLTEVCFNSEVQLNKTEYIQPAILATEIAMYVVIEKHFSIKADFFAGHSLGEYVALTAAGVVGIKDAFLIVNGRESLVQNTMKKGNGGMTALIYEDIETEQIAYVLKETSVEIANYNSPKQLVLSGPKQSLELATQLLKGHFPTMRMVSLDVGYPFHSSYMKSAEVELKNFLQPFLPRMDCSKSEVVLSNLTGNFHTASMMPDNLVKQLSHSVQWGRCMSNLIECSDEIIEIGPNRVLKRFFSDAGKTISSIYNLRSLNNYLKSSSSV